jgi:hypothetical protein
MFKVKIYGIKKGKLLLPFVIPLGYWLKAQPIVYVCFMFKSKVVGAIVVLIFSVV